MARSSIRQVTSHSMYSLVVEHFDPGKNGIKAKVGFHVYSDFCPHLNFLKILCGEKSKYLGPKIDLKTLICLWLWLKNIESLCTTLKLYVSIFVKHKTFHNTLSIVEQYLI